MRIVPAIDIIDGRCVRLAQGNYAEKTIYNEDPVTVAKNFYSSGLNRLHLVDLDGAKKGEPCNLNILEKICAATSLQVDYSGGLRKTGALKDAFNAGATQITIGSAAVSDQKSVAGWFETFGGKKIILGADIKDGYVAVKGWTEQSTIKLIDLISRYLPVGLEFVMATDIKRDGMLQGAANELYAEMIQQFPNLKIIASGGVSSINDLRELNEQGVYEAIVGKALYEDKITLSELQPWR